MGQNPRFVDQPPYALAIDSPHFRPKSDYLLTFWETTELRADDVVRMRRNKPKIIVTCKFTADVFKSQGFDTRTIILAAEHNPVLLPEFKPFTFYTIYADTGYKERKRAQDIVDAFSLAFKNEPDVKLVMKQGTTCNPLVTFDSRIKIIREYVPDVGYLHKEGHVFVSACAAEGWGYPHHDAMAFGRPVICPRMGGPLEFLDESCAWFLPVRMVKSPGGFYDSYGKIGAINVRDMAAAMRHAYYNRVEVMEKSTAAFVRARKFTLDQMTVSVKHAFDL
jgi:glycosyltransferase involved in cell wall biosynthesis